MSTVTARFRTIAGTEAEIGIVEGRTLVADRAPGKAGGQGLGFSGSQLMAAALGACFCNTLRKQAHQMKVVLGRVEVDVDFEMEGDPLTATGATLRVRCERADGSPAHDVIERSRNTGMVSRSVAFPVRVEIV